MTQAPAQQTRHFVPAPGMAVLTTEYRKKVGSIWLPDTSWAPENRGTVLGIGALKDAEIPLRQNDVVTYAPYAPKEFDLGDGIFTMVAVKDIFTITGDEQRVPLLYDYRLPKGSLAGDKLAWLIKGHALVRPYSPVGFKKIGGLDHLSDEKRTIWLERDEKHPAVWAHVLAIRHDDWKRTGVFPGDFVLFARHSEEVLGTEKPRAARWRRELKIAITNIENLEALGHGDDVPKAEF